MFSFHWTIFVSILFIIALFTIRILKMLNIKFPKFGRQTDVSKNTDSKSGESKWSKDVLPWLWGSAAIIAFVVIVCGIGMWSVEKFNDFVKTPEPFKSIAYEPSKYGLKGMDVEIPEEYTFTQCSGKYSQLFLKPSLHRDEISCNGIFSSNMAEWAIRKMPIEDAGRYGAIIIKSKSKNIVNINVNLPQEDNFYSDLIGTLYIDFLH